MFRRAALVLALAACHHDPAPAPPAAETAPLPPASGTPIGYLIDDATALQLTDDQLAQLHQIDTALASELETIDAKLRTANKPADAASSEPTQPMGRHGRHGGGMGGSRGHHRGSGAGSGSAAPHAADADRLTEQRADDVRDAIRRALALFQPAQQQAATKVLADHDIDVDAGRPEPGGAEPGGGEP